MVVALSLPSSPSSSSAQCHPLWSKSLSRSRLRPGPGPKPRLPRAALVEARPRPRPGSGGGGGSGGEYGIQPAESVALAPAALVISARDRTEDMKAEAKAMARASNVSVYSPQLLEQKYGSRPIKVALRALEILTGLGTFALKLLLDDRQGLLGQRKRQRAAELRGIFTRLGPTFVKIGQGLSTRPDICPPEYLEELSELQVADDNMM